MSSEEEILKQLKSMPKEKLEELQKMIIELAKDLEEPVRIAFEYGKKMAEQLKRENPIAFKLTWKLIKTYLKSQILQNDPILRDMIRIAYLFRNPILFLYYDKERFLTEKED